MVYYFFVSKIRPSIYLTSRSLCVLFLFGTGEKGKPGAAGLSGYPGAPGEKGDKGTFGKDGAAGEKGERVRANRNRNFLKHNRTDGLWRVIGTKRLHENRHDHRHRVKLASIFIFVLCFLSRGTQDYREKEEKRAREWVIIILKIKR